MSFVEFLLEYYVYIVIILILLIVTVIGFIVDSKNKESRNTNKSSSNDLEVTGMNDNANVIEQKQASVVENTSLDVNGVVSGNSSNMDNSLNMGQEVSFQSINVLNGVSDSINNEQVINAPVSLGQQVVDNINQVVSPDVSSFNAQVQGVVYVNDGQLMNQNLESSLINDNANVVASNVNQVVYAKNVSNNDLNQVAQPIGYVNNIQNLQTNYQMPNYNNQVNNVTQGMEYYSGVMQHGINNYTEPNGNYNISNNQVMPNMNFNQNVISGNSQAVNQQQGLYYQAGVGNINPLQMVMPSPMSIDTLNGVANQNFAGSVSSPLNNSDGVNGQNTSLLNANNIDNNSINNNNFVMENSNQTVNNINNGNVNSNVVFTTNGSQPFDVTSMFVNNNQ